jgi:hypothetical protein
MLKLLIAKGKHQLKHSKVALDLVCIPKDFFAFRFHGATSRT